MDPARRWRFLVLLQYILVFYNSYAAARYTNQDYFRLRPKRDNGENMYLSNSYIVPDGDFGDGWGPWETPSACSRSCGGGVTSQRRRCEKFDYEGRPACEGGSVKYYSCNTQDCPEGSIDFRSEQCSAYDDKLYYDRKFQWLPYTKAVNPCELHCMPKGERFYYRHNTKVVDGTLCYEDSLDVCVNGQCQHVGCDMMLGSDTKEDKCRQCGGNSTACNTVEGVYDNDDLVQGYNDLLLIPQGATNIEVKERQPSYNYLAVRNREGVYYLNGNWKIDFPRSFTFAGCVWIYERKSTVATSAPDSIKCLGPTSEPVYVQLLSQANNVGVQYEYSVPLGISQNIHDEYVWVHSNFTGCSATCGGGYQSRNVTCVSKNDLRTVSDNLCDEGLKLAARQSCANIPCEPEWVEDEWGECSAPCGEGGTQSRRVYCKKVVAHGIASLVQDEECFQMLGSKPALHQKCNVDLPCPDWHVGPWNPCDKLCGEGTQRRSVTCYRKNNGKVEVLDDAQCAKEKPQKEKSCLLHPCEGVDWVISEWSGCDSCTSKLRTRTAYCASVGGDVFPKSFCSNHPEPELQENCDPASLPACAALWFASQWSKCSGKCGNGVQSRRVFCGIFNGDTLQKVPDERCKDAENKQYETTRPCELDENDCPAEWYAGPWSECTKQCGSGNQERKVMCLRENKTVDTSECDAVNILIGFRDCNTQSCTDDEVLPVDVSSTEPVGDYDDEDWCDEDDYEDSAVTEEIELETEKSVTTDDDMMLSDAPTDGFSGDGTGSTLSETGSGDMETSSVSGMTTEDIEKSTLSEFTQTEGSGDVPMSTTENEKLTDTTIVESSTSSIKSDGSESDSSSSASDESTSSEVASSEQITSSEEINTMEQGSTTESFSTVDSKSSESEPTSSTFKDITIEQSTIDVSTTGFTTIDVSTTDVSTTDVSTTDISTTDVSTTDVSTTDVPTTEISTTDKVSSEASTISDVSTAGSSQSIISTQGADSTIAETTYLPDVQGEVEVTDREEPSDSLVTDKSATDSSVSSSEQINTEKSDIVSTGETEFNNTDFTTIVVSTVEMTSDHYSTIEGESTTGESTISSGSDSTDITESTGEVSTESYSGLTTETMPGETTPWGWTLSTLEDIVGKELMTTRKCKKRPKAKGCSKSKYGCCSDNKTTATGPFEQGCPTPETCKETKHGCCPDGVSPAQGSKNKGCPKIACKETLYGCCDDKKTPSQGNNKEGCPPPPPPCSKSKHGCCADNKQEAKGPNKKGCPETEKPTTVPAVGCKDSKFGCCDDNNTVATGPEKDGCSCSTYKHGCCPDQKTPATGPDNEGCSLGCNTTSFGCCPDNATPSHGPLREGCCLKTEYGCCPDNIVAARGPNNEGCGCQWSPYGCCPDNTTSAKGPENEGCGCQYTPHGCCPDRKTVSLGANYESCPCHTYQFGCCPDGKRVAKGPRQQGCGCSESEFGCCSDEETAAGGLNGTGCDCASTKYGCCPDGVSEAKGEEFEGCEDKPETPQIYCKLVKERGPCRNYTINWFYDMDYGGCSRFWYGGCEGNKNRFASQEECKDVCVEPQGKDVCKLPKVAGLCEGYIPTWYYDSEEKRCAQFAYGGCLGNMNRFETREQCEKLCGEPTVKDQCEQEQDRGICSGSYTRYAYDSESRTCNAFEWGGCGGNKNRFISDSACLLQCDTPGKLKDICMLPRLSGNCSDNLAKWSFDRRENRCMPFYYSGCNGNHNQFYSEEECDRACPKVVAEDICVLPPSVGDCDNYHHRWYYNTAEKSCQLFYYGGCGGNKNNFASESDCLSRCKESDVPTQPEVQTPSEPFRSEFCFLNSDTGPCRVAQTRWFYDSTDGICKQFLYGGCEGNKNNFMAKEECEEHCSNVQDICQLPMAVGPCRGSFDRWFYDKDTDSCSKFAYGGCEGNQNRFEGKSDCEQRCKRGPTEVENKTQPPYEELPRKCYEGYDPGNCEDRIQSWFYDVNSGGCRNFLYTGCGGNNNRFVSEEQCERQCGEFRQLDVCRYNLDAGPCDQAHRKVYFNDTLGRCLEFLYGGCGGSPNRFSTISECDSVCLDRKEPVDESVKQISPAVCHLPPTTGSCAQYAKRWHFSVKYKKCITFIYSGCDGNENNFPSRKKCIEACHRAKDVNTIDNRINTDNCREHEERCANIRCSYGITRSVDASGCEICVCNDPCLAVRCDSDSRCVVEAYTDQVTRETRYHPECRPVIKGGECPVSSNSVYEEERADQCETECRDDLDCQGEEKCCRINCSYLCVQPSLRPQPAYTPEPTVGYTGAAPPRVDETQDPEVSASEGNVAVLKCLVYGNPAPTVTWRKEDILIDGSSGRYRILTDGTLQIVSVYRNDSGVYICVADNGIGKPVTKEFNLQVKDPEFGAAQIIETSDSMIGTIGSPVLLRCLAYGYPAPNVQWWRGANIVPVDSEQYEFRRDNSLLIRSLQLNILDKYTCYVYNGRGKPSQLSVTVKATRPRTLSDEDFEIYREFLIDTYERPISVTPRPYKPVPTKKIPEPVYNVPVYVNITTDRRTFTVGSELSLLCVVDGYPVPQVHWYKDGAILYRDERTEISETNRLTISSLNSTDSGEYRCEANNGYSSAYSSLEITVEATNPTCTDNPYFANCKLIVRAKYCDHQYYAKFCCRSCTEAGLLNI